MADFSVAVEQWVKKAKERAEQAYRAIAEDALARAKELTPVDTGYLRANFVTVLEGEAIPKDEPTPETMAGINRAKVGDTILIVNPVPYARRIEYGFVGEDSLGRKYDQKGRHMVAQTVAEMPRIAEEAVKRVTRP